MESLKIRIDDREIDASAGMTILQAAEKAGISIPTLCHHRDFIPTGSCRICVVELEGSNRLVGSCHTPVAKGMVAPHPLPQSPLCPESDRRAVAGGPHRTLRHGYQGSPVRICTKSPRTWKWRRPGSASQGPAFTRSKTSVLTFTGILSKCILCSRCISACSDIAGQYVFSTGYRSFHSKVVVDNDIPLDKDVCKDCYVCVEYCPTTALSKAKQPMTKKEGRKWSPARLSRMPRDTQVRQPASHAQESAGQIPLRVAKVHGQHRRFHESLDQRSVWRFDFLLLPFHQAAREKCHPGLQKRSLLSFRDPT